MASVDRCEKEFREFHRQYRKIPSYKELSDDCCVVGNYTGEEITLTLMAIIHGDEVAGLAVLNQVLAKLLNGFPLSLSVAFVLGNYRATKKNKRFLARDLNRCFSSQTTDLWEEKRAQEIAKVLSRSKFLLDFHQTAYRSDSSFSIFPFSAENVAWSQKVHQGKPMVTRFDGAFSAEGMSSDEYALQKGGTGITIELGKKGFDKQQIIHGLQVAMRAIAFVHSGESLTTEAGGELYTIAQRVRYPRDGNYQLSAGLYNFKAVEAGECLAHVQGEKVLSQVDGYVLFPKYQINPKAPHSDVCHVLTKSYYEKFPE